MITTTAQDARWAAVRAGLSRGWIETLQTSAFNFWLQPLLYVGILFFLRERTLPGTDFALIAMMLPGFIGYSTAFGGFTGAFGTIATDAEDGTLLRAKATPNGMLGYLVGKIVTLLLKTFAGLVALVIPGSLIVGGLALDARTWLLLVLIFVAGMVSTVPIGLAIGSLLRSSAWTLLPGAVSVLLVLGSGLFLPLTILPTWLQWVAQAFPFYWVGLGTRAALLPAEMAAVEIGGSWRMLETFAVLGLWAAIGVLLAQVLLRRMARRQSGSTVAATRERLMSRGY